MTRATDGDTGAKLISATFPVREGGVNQDTWWTVTNDSIVLGTTSIVLAQTGGAGTYSAGNGITLTGNQFSQTGRSIDGQSYNGSADITVIAPGTHAATGKTTPVDADEVPLVDSAAANVLKKLTWANLKATMKAYMDSVSHTWVLNNHHSVVGGTGAGFWLDSVTTGADRFFFGSDAATADVFRIYSVLAANNVFQYAANATPSLGALVLQGSFSLTGGLSSNNPTAGVGYATGAGGTVTQATSKSTGVTLNKVSGEITMNNAALAAATTVSFVLTDSAIGANDVLTLNHVSGGTPGSYGLNARCAAGSATIDVRNNTAGSLSEAIVLRFTLMKGATS